MKHDEIDAPAIKAVRSWVILILLVILCWSAVTIEAYRIRLPFWDEFLHDIQLRDQGIWSAVTGAHFGHLQHLTKLLYFADTLALDGNGEWLISVNFLCYAACGVLIAKLSADRREGDFWQIALICAASLLWLGHWANLLWGIQIQVVLGLVLGLTAALVQISMGPRFRLGHWLAAKSLAILACFGSGSGLAMVATLVILALLQLWPKRQMMLEVATALSILIGYYFASQHGMFAIFNEHPFRTLEQPLVLLQHAIEQISLLPDAFLSSAVNPRIIGEAPTEQSVWHYPVRFLSICAMLTLAWRFLLLLRSRKPVARAELAGWVLIGFGIFYTGLAVIARGQEAPVFPTPARYMVQSIAFWLGGLLVLGHCLAKNKRHMVRQWMMFLWTLGLVTSQPLFERLSRENDQRLRAAEIAGLNGAYSADALRPSSFFLKDEEYISEYEWLRERRARLFAWPEFEWFGAILSDLPAASFSCRLIAKPVQEERVGVRRFAGIGIAGKENVKFLGVLWPDALGRVAAIGLPYPDRRNQEGEWLAIADAGLFASKDVSLLFEDEGREVRCEVPWP